MRGRLAALGLAPSTPPGMFRQVPPTQPPRSDPETTRQRRETEAEVKVRQAMKVARMNGQPVDVRKFSATELEVYKRLRGPSTTYIESRGAPSGE